MTTESTKRGQWGTRPGFILAAAGSAVGLGNIWKFPYITGENGGGLFVLIYLVCVAFVGLPIMMAEIMIGRAAQRQPIVAFERLQGGRSAWTGVGWLGVAAGFVILSYYVVVCGWVLDYTLKSVVNFTGPLEEQAQTEARTYRASASLDEMKQLLIKKHADREVHEELITIRSEASKQTWKHYGSFKQALDKAETDSGAKAQARARLLEDPQLAEAVRQAEALEQKGAAALEKATLRVREHFAPLPPETIRAQAEVEYRRAVLSRKVASVFKASAEDLKQGKKGIADDGWLSALWAALFMAVAVSVVAAGISGGIERWCKVLMPVLIGIILIMVIYGAFTPGFSQAVSFVFKPDASRLKTSGVLEALGHAFFTLSLGMGAMITYGSYQKTKGGLARQSGSIRRLPC